VVGEDDVEYKLDGDDAKRLNGWGILSKRWWGLLKGYDWDEL